MLIEENGFQLHLHQGSCVYCEKKTFIFHRKYSGETLCKECFIMSIERNISKTISKYKMLKYNDKIVVGLSGGKDSIALLHNLIKIQRRKYGSEPITALIIDEGINGYRNESINCATKFCKQNDLDYEIVKFEEKIGKTLDDIIKMKKESPEYLYACNYCATIRRRLLNEGARELDADVLAMGHNLTDIAETFLMNILFKRLNLIGNQYMFKEKDRGKFIKKITPLMKIPEEEIFLYSNLKEFQYYPSHCPYREKDPILRKRVLNFIQECKKMSPEIEFNLLNGFLELSETIYSHTETNKSNNCIRCGYPCGNSKICLYCKYKDEFSQ